MVYERYSSLLTENTHFGFNDVEAPKVSGYEGTTGCISALIEGATIAQNMFTDLINVDFLQEAADQGIRGITESDVNEYIYEAEDEKTDSGSTENKTDSKSDDKKGGIVSKIISALKNFWAMARNAITKGMLKLKVYLTKDLSKWVKDHNLKSMEEIRKMSKIKVYKEINTKGIFDFKKLPSLSECANGNNKITVGMIASKQIGKEVSDLGAMEKAVMESNITEKKDVSIADVINDCKSILSSGNDDLKIIQTDQKDIDTNYKKDLATAKSNKKAVKKNGEYIVKDDKGAESTVKPEDKDKYVQERVTEIEFLKNRNSVEMTCIRILFKLTSMKIAQAKAIYAKACGGKADSKEDTSKATDTPPETKGDETQEDQAANEAAFLEAVEYETEMELESIDWDELEEA